MITIRHDEQVSLQQVQQVAQGASVQVAEQTVRLLDERRAQVVGRVARTRQPAYGFNRGFGHNVHIPVPAEHMAALQENLIKSHAAGVGSPVPRQVVRAAMFLRLVSLSRGHSGIRAVVAVRLAELLNHDIMPMVPGYGSVGASGDLAPMSHVALAVLGLGRCTVGASPEPVLVADALRQVGLEPLTLEMKEGLALNNGVQFSTALGVLTYFRMRDLLRTAAVATAISTQVMLGADTPFRQDLHALRPHPGALTVARWIWDLLQDSPIREAHKPYDIDGEIQDPYNIRCAAQILGACQELIEDAGRTLAIEVNSVTDNPIILRDEGADTYTTITSGGHFHGMPIAVKLYNFAQAMGIMARLSNMRCARFIDEARNKGLGSDLKWPHLSDADKATSSAMMIPEYTSAALTNAIWGAAMPTHLFSLSTDAGQEDHVSMSATLALRIWDTLPRLAEVLAIELAFTAQAAGVRRVMDHIPSRRPLTSEERAQVVEQRRNYEEAIKAVLGGSGFTVIDLPDNTGHQLALDGNNHPSSGLDLVSQVIGHNVGQGTVQG